MICSDNQNKNLINKEMTKTDFLKKQFGFVFLPDLTEKAEFTFYELHTLLEDYEKAMNYSQCCKSDSGLLNHEDLEIGEQVRITQTKLVEINCFREDGDIDVEDTTSVFTVSLNEISRVV